MKEICHHSSVFCSNIVLLWNNIFLLLSGSCEVDMDEKDDEKQMPSQQGVFLIVNRQMIPIVKNKTTLGRHLENDIVFHEEFLSRYHAEIINEDGKYVLYDKNSTSGTFVNGKKIERCVLNSGDLISFANINIMFVNNNAKIQDKSTGTTQTLRTPSDA
jgi:pSer/pThr/pTyr-binding forkhead associated (FHA) protein